MTLNARILAANTHDRSRYRRWGLRTAAGEFRRVGHLREDRLVEDRELLSAFQSLDAEELVLAPEALQPFLDGLAPELLARERIAELSGEMFPVWSAVGDSVLASVDRRLVAWLGIPASGVHVNVFRYIDGELQVWIARRALDKLLFPGQLDNAVAGGQPVGLGLAENVVKECGEEAGIPVELATQAEPVGVVQYVFENDSGLKPDTLYCFDLELPADFVPAPVDGEVDSFRSVSLTELRDLLAGEPVFKFNSALVCIDFLLRRTGDELDLGDRESLQASLRRRLDD
ncbi:MAG: NUDIX domain-containing protein [Planctomycetota bacterium]